MKIRGRVNSIPLRWSRSKALLSLLALLSVNTVISDPEHFKSFDGNYTLEFGYSAVFDSFKIDPMNIFEISIENNAFVINSLPYEYDCKIYQNHTTGGFFQNTVVRCNLKYDQDLVKAWADKTEAVFCNERGFFDVQDCIVDRHIKGYQQTFILEIVKDHLFLQRIISDGPDSYWFTGDVDFDGESNKDTIGLNNQILLKKRSNFFEKFNIGPTKEFCDYLSSGCSFPDEWANFVEELDLMLIEKFNNVKRNLSISNPSSNYFVFGEDLYLNDGSEGELVGGILGGVVAEGACLYFLSLPGCSVAGSELGSYYGRKLTVQDGSTIKQSVCVGYFHVYGNKQVFNFGDHIYLCEEFSHPAKRDYSEYIPTYFTKPYIGFFAREYEGID